MTEGDIKYKDEYLVRVKAQVMTRDDSTGGWVPMGGGGVSIVGLQKLTSAGGDDDHHEYLIYGHHMSDHSVVLNCILKKEMQYTKANPTFHHWTIEDKRFGLTFQTHSDAKTFENGVRRAVVELLEGSTNSSKGEEDVFMTLDLPLGRKNSSSQSASTASTTTSSPTAQSPSLSPTLPGDNFNPASHHHLHRVHYMPRLPGKQTPPPPGSPTPPSTETLTTKSGNVEINGRGSVDDIWVKADSHYKPNHPLSNQPDDIIEMATEYSYVQFQRSRPSLHEYSYPNLDKSPQLPDNISDIKSKHNQEVLSSQPPLPKKKKDRTKKKKVPTATLR